MLKIGKLTDYAAVILNHLANAGEGGSKSAYTISAETSLPEPTVAKVLKALAAGGLVLSTRGAMGGYRLARAKHDISLADIITAIEGPIALVACVEGSDESCKINDACQMRGRWDSVNAAVRAALDAVKLSDIPKSECGDIFIAPPAAHKVS